METSLLLIDLNEFRPIYESFDRLGGFFVPEKERGFDSIAIQSMAQGENNPFTVK
jgi:hypothetical protein